MWTPAASRSGEPANASPTTTPVSAARTTRMATRRATNALRARRFGRRVGRARDNGRRRDKWRSLASVRAVSGTGTRASNRHTLVAHSGNEVTLSAVEYEVGGGLG